MGTYLSFVDCTVIFLSSVECTVNFLLLSSLYSTYSKSLYFKALYRQILSSVDCMVTNLQHSNR